MNSKIFSIALIGFELEIIEVEVDIRRGQNKIYIVGLPDKAVSEAKERLIPALKNSLTGMPKGTVTINLAPANIPKSGSLYDLAIAVGILAASGYIRISKENKIFMGELSLNGELRSVSGVLPALVKAKERGYKEFFIPEDNKQEASLVDGVSIFPAKNLNEIVYHFNNQPINPYKPSEYLSVNNDYKYSYDFNQVKGQKHAKRALEIAAAGGHNCLLSGVPGSGKTLLSKTLPTILPDVTIEEGLEITQIYSLSNKLPKDVSLITERPFRSPHHTTSQVALVGGGSIPKPGEITLAHRGVLFLDEFPEFTKKSLESLRQPLEDKVISISRASGTLTFPANFTLIAAMNPCPCGYRGDPDKECVCTASEYLRYQKKISGPVLDRIDLQVNVPKVNIKNLTSSKKEESSESVKKRVQIARNIQKLRFAKIQQVTSNSDMNNALIKKHINLNKASLELLKSAIDSLNLTARSYYRILKVSRTIADLEQSESVRKSHIAEAISYRL